MAKGLKDSYSNKAYGTVTESGVGTLTFNELVTNVNVFAKIAWVINRIEWYINIATLALMDGPGDAIQFGLTASDNIIGLDLDNSAVIDMAQISTKGHGTPANMVLYEFPLIRDFGFMPGGGLIVAPRPLFTAVVAASIASPATVECRIFFQILEMTPADYIELIDFYRIVG